MNTRLQQFISAENITQSQFADSIGVARASVSHIIAGRNKPGFDFILGMARTYPALNIDWLITGKGKMYRQAEQTLQLNSNDVLIDDIFASQFSSTEAPSERIRRLHNSVEDSPIVKQQDSLEASDHISSNQNTTIESKSSNTLSNNCQSIVKQRSITKIVVFYDDNTFQELR